MATELSPSFRTLRKDFTIALLWEFRSHSEVSRGLHITADALILVSFSVLKKFMKCCGRLLKCVIYSDENKYKILKAVAGFFYGVLLGIGK
jgi:hypothetical protein